MDLHPSIQITWALANRSACLAGSSRIEPSYFLLAALEVMDDAFSGHARDLGLSQGDIDQITDLARQAQEVMGLSDEEVTHTRRALRKQLIPEQALYVNMSMLHRSDFSRRLFIEAAQSAAQQQHSQVTLVDLVRVLIQNLPPEVAPLFEGRPGYRIAEPQQTAAGAGTPLGEGAALPNLNPASRTPVLDALGRDLTALARASTLPPVIGRVQEMTALARHLMRTTKRNTILVGPAGVGKTAVVMGLAQRITQPNAPEFLRKLRIVQINVGDLVAGTRYRGDMEERLRQLVTEASSDPNLVLFLDEIHMVMKSSGDSPMDIANLLKTALERDAIRCIGATTTDEFERYIKEDPAFLRRFQVLRLKEPDYAQALEICQSWAGRIEKIQGTHFTPEAVEAAVSLSMRLIRDRSLPDKAIDLMENAATYVKVATLMFENAPQTPAQPSETLQVEVAHIQAVLEEQYGIPVEAAEGFDMQKLTADLRHEIIGQDAGIDAFLETLHGLLLHPPANDRALGVFMFTGPTGVGKTFLAEVLARSLYGREGRHLLRINMNEFKEPYDLSRLTGAAPGLIGHDRQGTLFAFTSEYRRGVILLDEIEKAHPEVQDYFLQIFDRGEALSSRGQKADFRQTIFLITCNLGTAAAASAPMGLLPREQEADAEGEAIRRLLVRHFRPEFLGRIDRIIEFHALRREDFEEMLQHQLDALAAEMLEEHQVTLEVPSAAFKTLADALCEQPDGMRGLLRAFRSEVALPTLQKAAGMEAGSTLVLGENGRASS